MRLIKYFHNQQPPAIATLSNMLLEVAEPTLRPDISHSPRAACSGLLHVLGYLILVDGVDSSVA